MGSRYKITPSLSALRYLISFTMRNDENEKKENSYMANNMTGKRFKIAIGTRESLNKCGKILQQVDCFIDGQTGT